MKKKTKNLNQREKTANSYEKPVLFRIVCGTRHPEQTCRVLGITAVQVTSGTIFTEMNQFSGPLSIRFFKLSRNLILVSSKF